MTVSNIADECIHGLTAAWCATCKENTGREARLKRKRELAWRVPKADHIEARFRSLCPMCNEVIHEGDDIYRLGTEWVCATCSLEQEGS